MEKDIIKDLQDNLYQKLKYYRSITNVSFVNCLYNSIFFLKPNMIYYLECREYQVKMLSFNDLVKLNIPDLIIHMQEIKDAIKYY